ncbi:MAG: molybdopterin molybdotransferase MoeA [Sporomusaceae bacterium]|nr:molybdopterin molybdotransferase MoeA [Sporomusaceae bacterium]
MKPDHGVALEEALKVILQSLAHLEPEVEEVALATVLGRIAAVDMVAKEDLPPFDRAAIDGFAIHSSDVKDASLEQPVSLRISGAVRMGEAAGFVLQPGEAALIPTGGMLPPGADAVLMLPTSSSVVEDRLLVPYPVTAQENVILRGEDFKQDVLVAKRGEVLSPQLIGALAACGYSSVKVNKRTRAAILSTGDEVVDVGGTVGEGQIRDVNSYALGAVLEQVGCQVERCGIVPDESETLYGAMEKALVSSDLILISGGSSAGAREKTLEVLQRFDTQGVLLKEIAVNPGKLTIFAMIGRTPVFALPGQPVAAMTVCNALVKPAAALLLGQKPPEAVHRILARLTRSVASVMGRDDFIRVRLVRRGGDYWAEPIDGKPGLISTLLKADGIVHISEVKSGLYGQEWVEIELLN